MKWLWTPIPIPSPVEAADQIASSCPHDEHRVFFSFPVLHIAGHTGYYLHKSIRQMVSDLTEWLVASDVVIIGLGVDTCLSSTWVLQVCPLNLFAAAKSGSSKVRRPKWVESTWTDLKREVETEIARVWPSVKLARDAEGRRRNAIPQ